MKRERHYKLLDQTSRLLLSIEEMLLTPLLAEHSTQLQSALTVKTAMWQYTGQVEKRLDAKKATKYVIANNATNDYDRGSSTL